MDIAIFGGTFNPIHIGHTSIAQYIVDQKLADEVWLMIARRNPFKGNNAADYEARIDIAHLALKGMAHIRVSDFEHNLPTPSYTITTLTKLSEIYPQHKFSLVIGADNWERFAGWYEAEKILRNFSILIYCRPNFDIDTSSVPPYASVKIINAPMYDVSSTEIRNGQKLNMLNPDVLKYIRVHKLYF